MIRKSTIGIWLGLVLLIAAGGIARYIDTHPTIYRFPSEQIGFLSETEAVTITRRAIESSGRNPGEFAALAWGTREFEGKSEQTFARNTLNPNGGYVIWKHASGDPAKTVHVHIEKHDGSCECIVSTVK